MGLHQSYKLELCKEDGVGFLSDVTRIFRENGVSITRAEVSTRGLKTVNTFYMTHSFGDQVSPNGHNFWSTTSSQTAEESLNTFGFTDTFEYLTAADMFGKNRSSIIL